MLVAPTVLLVSLATVVVAIGVTARLVGARRARTIAEIARRSGWTYSRTDRFGLAGRVPSTFDVPGAADLQVEHVCYRSWPCGTWFVFTASYVVGVIRSRRRSRQVVGWLESQGQCGAVTRDEHGLLAGGERGTQPERYARLIGVITLATSSRSAATPGSPTSGRQRQK